MSATSSRLTTPSQSRSRIWKPSRSVLTCAGCSCESALPFASGFAVAVRDGGSGLCGNAAIVSAGDCPLGVQLSWVLVGVVGLANLDAPLGGAALVGDPLGVVCRSGEGEAGDSGRRKGEPREGGEP